MPETEESKVAATEESKVAELEARIKELEQQASNKEKSKTPFSGTSKKLLDESSSLYRGLVLGYIELIRAGGSVLSSFGNSVYEKNKVGKDTSATDAFSSLPADLFSAWSDAVQESLDIPGKAIDKFSEGYNETRRSE